MSEEKRDSRTLAPSRPCGPAGAGCRAYRPPCLWATGDGGAELRQGSGAGRARARSGTPWRRRSASSWAGSSRCPRRSSSDATGSAGIQAEFAKIGATPERFECPYRVLVDRISHEVKHYRFYLKDAALAGTFVINDPFWWSADDKFFGYSLAARIGVAVPRTAMLPQKDYIPAIDKHRSLRNLQFPLNWESVIDYIKFPAVLKPADGGGVEGRHDRALAGGALPRVRRVGPARDDAAGVHRFRGLRPLHLRRAGERAADPGTTPRAFTRRTGLRGAALSTRAGAGSPRRCTTGSSRTLFKLNRALGLCTT